LQELESGGLLLNATAPPFKKVTVGKLQLIDPSKGANLRNT
jgi:hypothetical protein